MKRNGLQVQPWEQRSCLALECGSKMGMKPRTARGSSAERLGQAPVAAPNGPLHSETRVVSTVAMLRQLPIC